VINDRIPCSSSTHVRIQHAKKVEKKKIAVLISVGKLWRENGEMAICGGVYVPMQQLCFQRRAGFVFTAGFEEGEMLCWSAYWTMDRASENFP
jgi:hypothetical protein